MKTATLKQSRLLINQRANYYRVWRLFKQVCQNTKERFNPTPANVRRWRWHIKEETKKKQEVEQTKKWERDLPQSFLKLIEKRRVRCWEDFDEKTQGVYRHIADLFPGSDVYACGSRVRGDYTEYLDQPEVKEWRKRAGKAEKERSDYDFFAPLNAICYGEIPEYADRLRHGIPENEKILIPMVAWDFTKLPEDQHGRIIELYNAGRWNELAALHDKYKLSPYDYCCDLSGLKRWYKYGIESGKINADTTTDPGI